MSIIGKLHEVSLYGLISAIVSIISGKASITSLYHAGFHITDFSTLFLAFLFWTSMIFLPVAVTGAFATKYKDGGEGLSFKSDKILVIIFAHIAEEILGLLSTPIWFLRDLFTRKLRDGWKIFDYITYLVEIAFIVIGLISIW